MKTNYDLYLERCRVTMQREGIVKNPNQIINQFEKKGSKNFKPYQNAIAELLKMGEWKKVNNHYEERNPKVQVNNLMAKVPETVTKDLLKKGTSSSCLDSAVNQVFANPALFANCDDSILRMLLTIMLKKERETTTDKPNTLNNFKAKILKIIEDIDAERY